MKDRIREIAAEIWPLALVLAIFCIAILMGGCKSANDIPVIHDTTYVNKIQYEDRYFHDSTYVHDSVMVIVKGDTIWVDRWHDRYHDVYIYDSCYIHDTSFVKEEVPVEVVKVEKKVSWFWTLFLSASVLGLIWALKNGILAKFWEFVKSLF